MKAKSEAQLWLERQQKKVYTRFAKGAEQQAKSQYTNREKDFRELVHEYVSRIPYLKPEDEERLLERDQDKQKIDVPTQFEDPNLYGILQRLSTRIEEAADVLSYPIPIHPLLGTLPTGMVNAMVVPRPSSNEYVVIFDPEVFMFALLLSKAVLMAMPITDAGKPHSVAVSSLETDWMKNVGENSEALRRFREVMQAYLIHGSPSAAPSYLPEGTYLILANILLQAMELFVMGHEYGHIISGHLSRSRTVVALVGGEKVLKLAHSWQQEFEADARGLELMTIAMQRSMGMDLSLSFWGADLFFSCMDVVDRGVSILRTGREEEKPSGSHPPVKSRRKALRELLRNSLPEDESVAPIEVGMTLERIIDALWTGTRPLLLDFYKRGVKPAPVWR